MPNNPAGNEPEDIFAGVDAPPPSSSPQPPSAVPRPSAAPGSQGEPAAPKPPQAPAGTPTAPASPLPPAGAPKPPSMSPVTPTPPQAPGQGGMPPMTPPPGGKKYGTGTKVLAAIAAVVLILGALGFIGWYIYQTYIAVPAEIISEFDDVSDEELAEVEDLLRDLNADLDVMEDAANLPGGDGREQPANEADQDEVPVNEPTSPLPTNQPVVNTPAVVPQEPVDTDQDGLTDTEERRYRTSISNHDTDGDGLSDFQEVRTYRTNPLNPDTDGDGYLDGEEVENNYNPKGSGMLVDPATAGEQAQE